MKSIYQFDVLKLFLAIVIVSLHASLNAPFFHEPFSVWFLNFQNFAVPCFFVLSSFVFFRKVNELPEEQHDRSIIGYEKRVILLYLAWSVIMLPITLRLHDYSLLGLVGILYYIKDFFFSYTFFASWFFGALIVGMPIVYLLRRKPVVLTILVIALYFYILFNGYLPYSLQTPYKWYSANIAYPNLSFPIGVVWMGLGCVLARIRVLERIKLAPKYIVGGVLCWC